MPRPESTPGPWFVRERPTDDGLAVIEDGRLDGLFPITCEWGEAHLVKAAPDMRSECQEAHHLLCRMRDGYPVSPQERDDLIEKLAVTMARADGDLE